MLPGAEAKNQMDKGTIMTYILAALHLLRSIIMTVRSQSAQPMPQHARTTQTKKHASTALTKDERINLRLQPSAKLMLERAASFEGQSVSKFVINCALAYAEKTIREHEVLQLNTQEAQAFFEALDQPLHFNSKLLDALAEHETRVLSR